MNFHPNDKGGVLDSSIPVVVGDKDIIDTTNCKSNIKVGLRFNKGKTRWALMDFEMLEGAVKVLEFGCDKYGEFNWKKGLKTTEICESSLRHIIAFLNGEDIDKESGISHSSHLICNAIFLEYMMKYKPEFDNRFIDKNKEIVKSL
jgi:hypothetical protein